jgi:hypothetical protein
VWCDASTTRRAKPKSATKGSPCGSIKTFRLEVAVQYAALMSVFSRRNFGDQLGHLFRSDRPALGVRKLRR